PDQFFKSLETCRVKSGRSLGLEWRIASREPSARCFRRKLHAGIVPDLLRPSLAADSFRARVGAKSYPHGYPDARYFFFTSEPKTARTCSDLRVLKTHESNLEFLGRGHDDLHISAGIRIDILFSLEVCQLSSLLFVFYRRGDLVVFLARLGLFFRLTGRLRRIGGRRYR